MTATRQVERRVLFEEALRSVNQQHLKVFRDHLGIRKGLGGMLRSERRKLARAHASRKWKRGRAEEQVA
jgi:hypothetical protein